MKLTITRPKSKLGELLGGLDINAPSTAVVFRVAAKAYTEQAVKTKASAVKTLHRERILTKAGEFTKAYALKV